MDVKELERITLRVFIYLNVRFSIKITMHRMVSERGDQQLNKYPALHQELTRNSLCKSTYTVFIDFRKAYVSTDSKLSWQKVFNTDKKAKLYRAPISFHTIVQCCIGYGLPTPWFDVRSGL